MINLSDLCRQRNFDNGNLVGIGVTFSRQFRRFHFDRFQDFKDPRHGCPRLEVIAPAAKGSRLGHEFLQNRLPQVFLLRQRDFLLLLFVILVRPVDGTTRRPVGYPHLIPVLFATATPQTTTEGHRTPKLKSQREFCSTPRTKVASQVARKYKRICQFTCELRRN